MAQPWPQPRGLGPHLGQKHCAPPMNHDGDPTNRITKVGRRQTWRQRTTRQSNCRHFGLPWPRAWVLWQRSSRPSSRWVSVVT